METTTAPIIYRGFEIHCLFNFSNGKSDYNVFAPDADYGYMAPEQTLDQVKNEIDEKISES